MFNQTEQFISQMKLRELQKQRERLLLAYSDLEKTLQSAENPAQRLKYLYEGLQEISFAHQKIHPSLANLEIILHESLDDPYRSDTLNFWLAELEKMLTQGQHRTEFVYIFGALLQEWILDTSHSQQNTAKDEFKADMLGYLVEKAPTGDYQVLWQNTALFQDANIDIILNPPEEDFTTHAIKIRRPVDPAELESTLRILASDKYRSPHQRQEATHFLQNQALLNDFADALTLMLENLDEWTWESDGLPPRIVWMRTRWRLLLDEDIVTACLLDILGKRWTIIFHKLLWHDWKRQVANLHHLLSIHAPQITIDNNLRQLRKISSAPSLDISANIWASEAASKFTPKTMSDQEIIAYVKEAWGEQNSIISQRAKLFEELHHQIGHQHYLGGDYDNGLRDALKLLHADIRITQATLPQQPIYILKFDLQDFYPSISHELIQTLLTLCQIPANELAFFQRFLQVPVQIDGQAQNLRRGLPLNCGLSHSLADLLLGILERYIKSVAHVHIIRIVDDICLLSLSADEMQRAWQAAQEFCDACGLSINQEKSGAVTINGTRLPNLPSNNPAWLMLELNEQGDWLVNEKRLAAVIEQTRARVTSQHAIISQVEHYNDGLDFLLNSLVMGLNLGEKHLASISTAIQRFHYAFGTDGESITQRLKRLINERFLSKNPTAIMDAWLYWPITAGGLGLKQPMIDLTRYSEGTKKLAKRPIPDQRPADWYHKNEWGTYYAQFLNPIYPAEPVNNDVMETLVKDFIQRGSKLSGGNQQGLSSYWRWILYTYGPHILASFGTFRFLISELVPVQLILQKRRQGTSNID